jgi:hypothetical protein
MTMRVHAHTSSDAAPPWIQAFRGDGESGRVCRRDPARRVVQVQAGYPRHPNDRAHAFFASFQRKLESILLLVVKPECNINMDSSFRWNDEEGR